jgi:hypothetical protein
MLFDWFCERRLTGADMRDVVADVWCAAEWPQGALGIAIWTMFFRMADYPAPGGPLTIYRGATQGRCRGMSWTTDRDKAQWFSQRFVATHDPAYVFAVEVPPEAVLADIDAVKGNGSRHEHEIVVDPSCLPRVRRFAAS